MRHIDSGMLLWIRHHWPALLTLLVLILLPLILLGSIAEDIHEKRVFVWEAPLMVGLRQHAPGWFHSTAAMFSTVGSAKVMLPFAAVLMVILWRKSHTMARYFLLSVGGTVLLNVALKLIFNRARPQVIPWLWQEGDASFPSGHSSMAMALVVTMTALLWRTPWRWPVAVLGTVYTLVMGISRVYLGVHYPTDVVGGWLLGLAWTGGIAVVMWSRLRPAQSHAARPGSVPGQDGLTAGP